MPKERVRVFMASSAEAMDEMLNRQNQGLVSHRWAANGMCAIQLAAARRPNAP